MSTDQPTKRRRKWPFVLVGIVLLIIVISAVSSNSDSGSTGNSTAPVAAPPAKSEAADDLVTYEVTGEGVSKAGNISFSNGSPGSISQANDESLPWSKGVKEASGLMGFYTVTAQSGSQSSGGAITCRIKKGDEVLAENTSSGPFAVVSCNGS